jgi:hypothetical protein
MTKQITKTRNGGKQVVSSTVIAIATAMIIGGYGLASGKILSNSEDIRQNATNIRNIERDIDDIKKIQMENQSDIKAILRAFNIQSSSSRY